MFYSPVVDLGTVTDDALASHLHRCARWRGALDAFEASMLAEFESRQIARSRGFQDSVAWLTSTTPTGETTARAMVQRAEILDALPAFGRELAAGEISADHLTSVIRAAGITGTEALVTDENLLAGWARTTKAKCFSRRVRRWVLEHRTETGDTPAEAARATRTVSAGIDATSGTGYLHAELPVDEHAILTNALWAIVDEQWRADKGADTPVPPHDALTFGQRLADALVEMARRATGASRGNVNPARPLLTVLIGLDTLTGRLTHTRTAAYTGSVTKSGGRLGDGTPIDAATARRLACEADIIPVVLGGQSQPLDVGRSRRLASRAQRAAMLTRSVTCEWPGCTTPAHWCQAHHLTPWETGGTTNLNNLMWTCTTHHHLCHEGNWRVTRNSHHTICVTPPTRTSPTTGTSSTPPPTTRTSSTPPPVEPAEPIPSPRSPSTDPPDGSRRPRRGPPPANTPTTPSQPPPTRRTRAA